MPDRERRRFFRLDDSLKLSYRTLAAEEISQQLEEDIPKSPIAALFSLDKRIGELVSYYQKHSPEMGEVLGLINKKVDSVIDLIAIESGIIHRVAYSVHEVNVSACGIAFSSSEPFEIGTILGLDIILSPDDHHISAMGKVVACEPLPCEDESKSEEYFLRVDYEKILEVDQEVLIQHLVRRQLVLYRRDKEKETAETVE